MPPFCQETANDYQPVTDEIPQEPQIAILRSHREHSFGLRRTNPEPQVALQSQYLNYQPFVYVHFVIGVKEKWTDEMWNCRMRPISLPENGIMFLDINDGRYMIESTLEPANGSTFIPSTDWRRDALPPYLAEVNFLLPAPVSMQYRVILKLFAMEGDNKRCLSSVIQKVTTFPEGSYFDDIQEGPGLDLLEFPLQKTKPSGILARAEGWKIIMHFQKLVDDGQKARFLEDKEIMTQFVENFPTYSDLSSCVLQEENFSYEDGQLVEFSKNAVKVAKQYHSPNEIFFHFRTKCTEAIWWAKNEDYLKAREYLEQASEICNEMAAGQFKAILSYEWAQYYAEKAASPQGFLSEEEREDAERHFDGVQQHHHSDELMAEVGNDRLLLQSLIRRMSFYLKTSRRSVPNFALEIRASELRKARDILDKIRENFAEPRLISKKHQGLLLMFETDLHIRSRNYVDAFASCTRGLVIARELNRGRWTIDRMKGRLRHVQLCLRQNDLVAELDQRRPDTGGTPDGAESATDIQYPAVPIQQLLEKVLNP